jgi:hypothetical protein
MPIKSKSQQRLLFAKEKRGELPEGTAERWVEHTPGSLKDLPERLHPKKKKGHTKQAFTEGLKETLKKIKPEHYDKAGLALLAAAPAYHTVKAVKENKPGEAALGASELGGLGLLYHAVRKAHA